MCPAPTCCIPDKAVPCVPCPHLLQVGKLTDGTEFDNSLTRGDPITFQLGMGRVIKGACVLGCAWGRW